MGVPVASIAGLEPIPLVPELMVRMDALKRDRVGNGLLFVRDWRDRKAGAPIPWAARTGGLRTMSKKARELLDACELDVEISFTSFRHGGMTELGDNDLIDAQIRAP